jgi:hypothetical protein
VEAASQPEEPAADHGEPDRQRRRFSFRRRRADEPAQQADTPAGAAPAPPGGAAAVPAANRMPAAPPDIPAQRQDDPGWPAQRPDGGGRAAQRSTGVPRRSGRGDDRAEPLGRDHGDLSSYPGRTAYEQAGAREREYAEPPRDYADQSRGYGGADQSRGYGGPARDRAEPTGKGYAEPVGGYADPAGQGYAEPAGRGYAAPSGQGYVPPGAREYVEPAVRDHAAPGLREHAEPTGRDHPAPATRGYGEPATPGYAGSSAPGTDGGDMWPDNGDAGGFWPATGDRGEWAGARGTPPEPPEWSVRRSRAQAAAAPAAPAAPTQAASAAVPPAAPAQPSRATPAVPYADLAGPPTVAPRAVPTSLFAPTEPEPTERPGPTERPEPTERPGPPNRVSPSPAAETGQPDRRDAWAASQRTTTTGQQPIVDMEPPPTWRKLLRSGRRARVRPGIFRPVAVTALVVVGWLAVVAYGALRVDLWWSLAALAAGVAGLALGMRGRSILGLIPVLAGAAAWGMATGDKVPASFSDIAGDVKLVGWNVAYAVPLLIAYGCSTWIDASRYARDRVWAALGERRWFGVADLPDAEPGMAVMETVPSARFFQLPSGSCPHLVTAGRRVALVRATVWPRGEYTVTEVGEVHRNGRIYANGSDDLNGVVADLRGWAERLDSVAPEGLGFLVVHPASGRPDDRVVINVPETRGVRVIPADEFVPGMGEFLAREPYRLDVALTERLGEHLPIFEPLD